MAEIISISVDTRKVENMLNGYQRNLPSAMGKMSKKIAGMYAAMYLTQLPRSRISPFTGHLFTKLQSQMTNPVRLGKGSYGVEIPLYGVYLDRMRPHWVSIHPRNFPINKWAKERGYRGRSIFVSPKPFIHQSNREIRAKARKMIEQEINKELKRRKR